jgi:hypothetical protein
MKTNHQEKRYRVVKYYNQWPQGDEFTVLGENLTHREAEKLRDKHSVGLKNIEIIIEKIH